MTKVFTWIVVVIIVVAGIWYFVARPSSSATPVDTTGTSVSSAGQANTASGTSDQDLDQDLTSVDAQMSAANSSGASAQGFSDTQVAQTE